MSVIDRLNRLVRANLNDFVSRTSSRSTLREVRNSLREARAQLVECRATEKRLAQEYEGLLDQAVSWEDRAMLALRSGDEALARKALYRKQEVESRARSVKNRLDEHRTYMLDLSRSLDAIEVKLEAIREHAQTAQVPGPGSEPRREPPSPEHDSQPWKLVELEAEAELDSLGDPQTFVAFDQMASRITRAEAELEALNELGTTPSGRWEPVDEIDARFKELEIKRELQRLAGQSDSLGDLKRRLNDE